MELLLNKDHLKYYNQDLYAKAEISVLFDTISSSEKDEFKKIFDIKNELLEKDPHNIVLHNGLNFFLYQLPQSELKKAAKEKHALIINKINTANKDIAQIAAKKIKKGSTVFVHSLNNQIYEILIHAAANNSFIINLVEHAPFSFGIFMSERLKEHNVKTRLFSDLAIKEAAMQADSCFIGGEVIIHGSGAIAKTGSYLAAEISKKHQIPLYVCAHSLKYDVKNRVANMLEHEYCHDKHDVRKVYEFLPKDLINAYVCEYGVFKPEHISDEIRFHNSWMFI